VAGATPLGVDPLGEMPEIISCAVTGGTLITTFPSLETVTTGTPGIVSGTGIKLPVTGSRIICAPGAASHPAIAGSSLNSQYNRLSSKRPITI
jgi:hypothetical protein